MDSGSNHEMWLVVTMMPPSALASRSRPRHCEIVSHLIIGHRMKTASRKPQPSLRRRRTRWVMTATLVPFRASAAVSLASPGGIERSRASIPVGLNTAVGWSIVLPVKSIEQAKSRLLRDDWARQQLMAAFLADILAALGAARHVSEVIVVGDDPLVRDIAEACGARSVAEGVAPGLNAAAATGLAATAPGSPVVVMVADLPCLTGPAIEHVLDLASAVPCSFVCDAAGTGTTMLAARKAKDCRPQFGPRSRARHAAAGNLELAPGEVDAFARARRDVDTEVDLWDAVRIGVGPATAAAMHVGGRQPDGT